MQIFALTTRGLEHLCAAEIASVTGFQIEKTAYRRVEGSFTGLLSALPGLRTVDDLFITLATWHDVSHQRHWLTTCAERSAQLDLKQYLATLSQLRPIPTSPMFSVTVNFVGKRNYTAPEVKAVIAESLTRQNKWLYAEDDREADLNVRVFIDHNTALVGLRLAAQPLHRRAYKQVHIPGALKPTAAAAMIHLAGVSAGAVMVDPFCGSGTIAIEAAQMGINSLTGDIAATAVEAAVTNAQAAAVSVAISHWDASHVPLRDQSVDYAISNMPWGRQVQVDAQLSRLYAQSFAEMKRIVISDGKIVLLTTFPALLADKPEREIEISLFGQNPKIVVFSVSH